jgi:chromosome segregation ATPase
MLLYTYCTDRAHAIPTASTLYARRCSRHVHPSRGAVFRQAALEIKEALMKAELRTEQLEQRLSLATTASEDRVHSLEAELAELARKAEAASEELGTLEEEKYELAADIEV